MIAPSAHAGSSGFVKNIQSNRCVAVTDASTLDGARLIQSSCETGSRGNENQQFEFVSVGNNQYNVRAKHSGKCMNVSGASQSNGASVIQWMCSNRSGDNDSWRVVPVDGGYWLKVAHSNKCLTIENDSNLDGVSAIQSKCINSGQPSQVFDLGAPPLDRNYGTLMLRNSGKCVEVPDASRVRGTIVRQTTCNAEKDQRFAARSVGNNQYRLLAEHSKLCVNVSNGSTAEDTNVVQQTCSNQSGASDAFTFRALRGGHQIIASHSGKCLQLKTVTRVNGAKLVQQTCNGSDSEIFSIGSLGRFDGGRWSAPIKFPIVPVGAAVMPTGEILAWSAYAPMSFGGNNGRTMTALYDPSDNTVSERTVSETGHDMFCPGTTQLADGRFMVTGGSSAGRTSIYEPFSSIWQQAPDMNKPRAYHSSTILEDGGVMVVGGSWAGGIGDKGAEVFRNNRWNVLEDVSSMPMIGADPAGMYRADNHMWLFAWTNDRVLQAGPSKRMHWIRTSGNGSVDYIADRGGDAYAMNGTAVMYEEGSILTTGGGPAYDRAQATGNANILTINDSDVTTTEVQSMFRPRAMHHSVVLPDGSVFVVGGLESGVAFIDDKSVLAPELFNPNTRTFKKLAPMSIPRNYHSVAVLMQDARIFVGGGGLCGSCQTNHADAQIFTPPYLIDNAGRMKPRPVITGAPSRLRYGRTAFIYTENRVKEFALLRVSSSTHSVNTDQRRLKVSHYVDRFGRNVVRAPANGGVAPPGSYMLFAINNNGVPSVARRIKVEP